MRLLLNKNFLPLVIVVFFAVLAGRSLLFERGYFNMHDDLQMMRQLQLEKCFSDGQIPCRWVPDMGYGFGFPLFNFYPPLPYLIGQIFRVVGYSFVDTAKLTFAFSFIVSGITMYFLSKEFFGKVGGVLSAVFYVWAPYHAVDVYVRGAMNEAWALAWFPLIFFTSYRLIKESAQNSKQWIIWLTLSFAFLFLTHNLMVLIFTPFFAVWVLVHLWMNNAWNKIPKLLLSGVWAVGIAAFFTLPAIFENKFTQVESQLQGYYDYTAHFVSINQLLFSRFWGYGPSVWVEADDKMSFQIGHLHWILSLVVGLILAAKAIGGIRKRGVTDTFKSDKVLTVTVFLFLLGWFAAFMTHLRSIGIYQAIPPLGYIQFSWRFLTLVIFGLSFVVGYLPSIFHSKKKLFDFAFLPFRFTIATLLIILVIILNWNYFKPEHGKLGALTDEQKFTGAAWELQQTAGIYDYLPSTAKEAPKGPQTVLAEIMEGEGALEKFSQGTFWGLFESKLTKDSKIRIGILNFPGWRVFIKENGTSKELNTYVPEEERWGRMWVDIPSGDHLVYVQFFNTPIRTFSNIISVLAILALLVFSFRKDRANVNI